MYVVKYKNINEWQGEIKSVDKITGKEFQMFSR